MYGEVLETIQDTDIALLSNASHGWSIEQYTACW